MQEKVLQCTHKRNNFFLIGQGIRALLTEGCLPYVTPEVADLKTYIEEEGVLIREKIVSMIKEQKTPLDLKMFDNELIQQGIQHAMELQNPQCTI